VPETAVTERAVYSARPTVRVDGQEYPLINELLISMELTEHEGGMSALELRLSNLASDTRNEADLAFEGGDILKLGTAIALYAGDQIAPQEIFRGTITGLEADFPEAGGPELVVLAEDPFQRARMRRRTTIYDEASIAGVARELARTLNLTPVVTGFTEKIGTQVQLDESDLAFLRRLLARYDGDLQVVGTELHVSPRRDVRRGTLELELHGQLRRVRVLADLAHQVTEVTVSGWDSTRGERVTAASSGANLGPGGGRTGAQILDAIRARSEHIGHLAVSSRAEAQAIADAAFDSRARRFVCLDGTAEGNPALRVGTHVTVSGLGNRFDNTYYVVRACHRYGSTGYETDFEAECAFWRER
jgi:phage protein D